MIWQTIAPFKGPVAIILGFVLGVIPFGLIIGKLFYDTDIREQGSGNTGAANTLRTLGRTAGIAVLLLDALKGFVPVFFAQHGGGAGYGVATGAAAVLGHCFSPCLRFKGGKGVATSLGVAFALWWPAGLTMVVAWLAFALSTGYSSVGSLAAVGLAWIPLWWRLGTVGLVYGVGVALLVVWKHRENIVRLREGRENRMEGRAAVRSNRGGLS